MSGLEEGRRLGGRDGAASVVRAVSPGAGAGETGRCLAGGELGREREPVAEPEPEP